MGASWGTVEDLAVGRLSSNQQPSDPEPEALPRLPPPDLEVLCASGSVKSVRSSRTENQFADFRTHSELRRMSIQPHLRGGRPASPSPDFQRPAALFRSRGNSSRKTRRSVASSGSRLVLTNSLNAALISV